jgi:UDP-GlcNAc:undecaprenyl-phosphate GlcNAc-1-phosphate transferase
LVSYRKRLFDMPNKRKVHKTPISRLGGISFLPVLIISVGLGAAIYLLSGSPIYHLNTDILFIRFDLLFVGLTMLYFIGMYDDLVGVNYQTKFFIQFICACLFPISDLWINSLGGLFGIYAIPAWFGKPLTVFLVVYITNAINLIDGVDGLASGLSSIALFVLGSYCVYFNHFIYAMLAFSMMGVLLPFWIYNVFGSVHHHHRIFMGDAGSLTLGYLLSFIVIHLSMVDEGYKPQGMLMIAFSTILIPLFDIVRVLLSRIRDGRPMFLPDKNHIHHKFIRTGMRIHQVMASILVLSLIFIAVNTIYVVYIRANITYLFIIDVAMFLVLHFTLNLVIYRYERLHPEKKKEIYYIYTKKKKL